MGGKIAEEARGDTYSQQWIGQFRQHSVENAGDTRVAAFDGIGGHGLLIAHMRPVCKRLINAFGEKRKTGRDDRTAVH
jgi:hypothetical protein